VAVLRLVEHKAFLTLAESGDTLVLTRSSSPSLKFPYPGAVERLARHLVKVRHEHLGGNLPPSDEPGRGQSPSS
jgi:hypothetical protein